MDSKLKMKNYTIFLVVGKIRLDSFHLAGLFILVIFIIMDVYVIHWLNSLAPGQLVLPYHSYNSSYPWDNINIKSLFMDPPDFYIINRLSLEIVRALDLSQYELITPNIVSYSHVFVALFAAKCISNDSLWIRRFGVLLFYLRNIFDSIDGILARKLGKQGMIMGGHNHYWGYWIDGICDALGSIFLYLGCYFYLRKHPTRNRCYDYSPILTKESSTMTNTLSMNNSSSSPSESCLLGGGGSGGSKIRIHRSGLVAIIFGFQTLLSSIAWNRIILKYSELIEDKGGNDKTPLIVQHQKEQLLRGWSIWIIVFIWRYLNPHAMLEVLLFSIFFDKMGTLLHSLKLLGFMVIIISAGVSEMHLKYVESIF